MKIILVTAGKRKYYSGFWLRFGSGVCDFIILIILGFVSGILLQMIFYDTINSNKIEVAYNAGIQDVSYYPKTKLYIAASGNASYAYISKDKFKTSEQIVFGQNYQDHAIDEEEKLIAIGTEDGKVMFWDLNSFQVVGKVLKHKFEVEGIVFHPENNRYVFTYMDGGNIYGWDRVEANIFMGPIKINTGRGLYLNKSGTTLSARGLNNRIYRLPVQIPLNDLSFETWLPNLSESLIGFKLNDSNMYDLVNKSNSSQFSMSKIQLSESMKNWVRWVERKNNLKLASPNGVSSIGDIIDVLAKSQNYRDLHKALLLNPSDPDILSNFAYYFLKSSNLDEFDKRYSIFCINKAREISNNSANVLFRSSQIEKLLDNQDDAIDFIDRALNVSPENLIYKNFKNYLIDSASGFNSSLRLPNNSLTILQSLIEKFDDNKDGKLSSKEKAKAIQSMPVNERKATMELFLKNRLN